ncbi:Protein SERAC1 [Apiospora arundinis]|uniref:Protein SERAC1 n=1 Tax=Apiospora arundinis TaxID=335852 RepID=A0ABR2I963_9PEZI
MMSAVAHSAQFLVGASVIVLLTAYIYQLFWGAHSPQRQMAGSGGNIPHQRRFRNLTLRVDLIPTGTSSKELESELKSIMARSPDLRGQLDDLVVRSIAPRDRTCACATVTGRALLSEEHLLTRLQDSSKAFPYRYDCAFYGITPLYEDASGAQCDAWSGKPCDRLVEIPRRNDLWLRDWLSDDIPKIRVLLYGYDAKLLKSNARSPVEDLGRRFLESLTAFRASDKTEHRPVILIDHSLGGLLIKEGSSHILFLISSSNAQMQPDGTLQKSGPPVLMVTRKSATSTGLSAVADEDIIPFDADHSGLVQFESRREDAYVVVKERIKSLVSGVVPGMEDPVAAPASKQKAGRRHSAWLYFWGPIYDQWREFLAGERDEPLRRVDSLRRRSTVECVIKCADFREHDALRSDYALCLEERKVILGAETIASFG